MIRICAAYSSELAQYFVNPCEPEVNKYLGYVLSQYERDWMHSDQLSLIFAVEKMRRTPLFTWIFEIFCQQLAV